MKKPKKLKKGDKVALVCPASRLYKDINPAIKILESWGLEVILKNTVHSHFGTFSADDEIRRNDLQECLDDPQIKAIIAARGGYGTVRIIDFLDFTKFSEAPKWIVGFSDITVLHSHLFTLLKTCSIHGQMPSAFKDSSDAALQTLHSALFEKPLAYHYTSSSSFNRDGKAKGQLIGGNLAILHSLLGSASDIDFTNKILFIEDVGEKVYNIDRMMWTLQRAGKLSHLKGLIVGGFTDLQFSKPPFHMDYAEIIYEKVKNYEYPVAFDFPAGHIDDNRSLIHGSEVDFKVSDSSISLLFN